MYVSYSRNNHDAAAAHGYSPTPDRTHGAHEGPMARKTADDTTDNTWNHRRLHCHSPMGFPGISTDFHTDRMCCLCWRRARSAQAGDFQLLLAIAVHSKHRKPL